MAKQWEFEADYYTACNCDWGCPCNFNARPTEGRCMGWGLWRIRQGRYEGTRLDGLCLALYYKFPGAIEDGQGSACAYVDERADAPQRAALHAIGTGQAGGGIFELFGQQLVTRWLPTRYVAIEFGLDAEGVGAVRIGSQGWAHNELLSYPDGSTIRPVSELPHGIEYKRGLNTNAREWAWHDEHLLAHYENKYGAVARVRFTQQGCVA